MDVPSGWVQIFRGPRSPSHQWPRADVQRKRQPHAPVGTGSERHRGSPVSSSPQQRQRQSGDSPQQSHVPRVSKSPDDVRKCAFSKVARLQAAIASLDEDDQETSSLQHALKRAQQQTVLPPVDQRIAHCVQFIERAKKRVQSAEADVKKAVEAQCLREEELAVAEQRLVDLQQEAARAVVVPSTFPHAHRTQAETAQPTVQQDILLQSGLWRFRGCAPRWPDSRQVDLSGIRSKQPTMCVRMQKNAALDSWTTCPPTNRI